MELGANKKLNIADVSLIRNSTVYEPTSVNVFRNPDETVYLKEYEFKLNAKEFNKGDKNIVHVEFDLNCDRYHPPSFIEGYYDDKLVWAYNSPKISWGIPTDVSVIRIVIKFYYTQSSYVGATCL